MMIGAGKGMAKGGAGGGGASDAALSGAGLGLGLGAGFSAFGKTGESEKIVKIRCSKCGELSPENAKFCASCGKTMAKPKKKK